MLKKVYDLLEVIGWRFNDYDEFIGLITSSKDTLDKKWADLSDGYEVKDAELIEALGLSIDILRALMMGDAIA
jgi:hypothetical protein